MHHTRFIQRVKPMNSLFNKHHSFIIQKFVTPVFEETCVTCICRSKRLCLMDRRSDGETKDGEVIPMSQLIYDCDTKNM